MYKFESEIHALPKCKVVNVFIFNLIFGYLLRYVQCWKLRNNLSHFFDKNIVKGKVSLPQCGKVLKMRSRWKKFREINSLVISLVKRWFDEKLIYFSVKIVIACVHSDVCTVWRNEKFSLTEKKKKIREIDSLVISLVKTLIWQKNVDFSVKVALLSQCGKMKNFTLTEIFPQISYLEIDWLLSWHFCQKSERVNFQ